jgi:uncharacterized membrane protein YphA (DoxX/SURF4 family)
MKAIKIIFWITTSIVAAMMLFDAYSYFTNPQMQQGFQHLGFPGYFREELGIAKIIGSIFLLIPLSRQLKEWTYAGFVIVFISAFIAHRSSGDPMAKAVMPLIFLVILFISYWSFHRLAQNGQQESSRMQRRHGSIA